MKLTLTCLLLMFCFGYVAFAQDNDKALAKAANNGRQLATQITVNGNVHVQAVLIPQIDARRIFGREIADNYAVIELNVGNKSPDAALIIHGVFIDYSHWPLSGSTRMDLYSGTDSFQASTSPNHVASEEYRVVRGQLLDAQNSTWRNRVLRWLTLAGNLAGAYTFSLNEKGIIQGIASATGVGIPGIATAWPDMTIEQLNRVSDFGFQTNKVISKQGSEVIVCFFPIDRFLTPGFKKLFLRSPALFFAPGLMLADRSVQKDVEKVLGQDLGLPIPLDELRAALPCYGQVALFLEKGIRPKVGLEICLAEFGLTEQRIADRLELKANPALFRRLLAIEFLHGVSLNNVIVTVDGVMSVDVNTIAAKIDDVTLDKVAACGDATTPCFWADSTAGGGVRTGRISGSYLTGGTVVIAEANDLGLTEVKTVTDGSTDQALNFSFKLTTPVPAERILHIKVTKARSGETRNLDSPEFLYPVSYGFKAPTISKVIQAGTKLTVNGTGFQDSPPDNSLVVTLRPLGAGDSDHDVVLDSTKFTRKSATELAVDIPEGTPPGCWTVLVKVGELPVQVPQKNTFLIAPSAASATLTEKVITVTGTGLDSSDCAGEPVRFRVLIGGKPVAFSLDGLPTSEEAKLKLTADPKADASITVKVLFKGKEVDKSPLQVQR
jgi:hypothetical protein